MDGDAHAGDIDYETADGSTFSLRGVWTINNGKPVFRYTTITAQVDGRAYTGKLSQPPDEVDDADVLNALEPVPRGCVHPKFPESFTEFTIAPNANLSERYFKAPSFTYDDCRPDHTFVADCILNEVSVFERLSHRPHRCIASYYGCLVKDGHITHICLERYPYSLRQFARQGLSREQSDRILEGVKAAIKHVHALGLVHNDINPDNVCVLRSGDPILIDFDGCLPVGEKLLKGIDYDARLDTGPHLSRLSNDFHGLSLIELFLRDCVHHPQSVGAADNRA